ncbi:MAG: response regulator, partial [Halobacteria archaeon]|nr:response regulator [Halobacteria archaeon]
MTANTLLCVDDDEDSIARFSNIAENTGSSDLNIVTASSLDEALDLLESRSIDCVISEYELPDNDGIELLKRVRQYRPDVLFILFTDDGDEKVASEAISAGVDAYIPKDDPREVYETLLNCMGKSLDTESGSGSGSTEESRYRKLVENSPNSICICAGDDYQIVYANDSFVELVGSESADEVVGTSFLEFAHPDYSTAVEMWLSGIIDDGEDAENVEQKLVGVEGDTRDV